MYMMPAEIVDRYTRRMEGTPQYRLDVLSVLNDCLPTDIAELLDIHGVEVQVDRISRALQMIMDEGASIKDAAREVGMTYSALRSRLYMRGLLHEPRLDTDEDSAIAMYETGATDSEVARAHGVVTSTARLWRQKKGINSAWERRKETVI